MREVETKALVRDRQISPAIQNQIRMRIVFINRWWVFPSLSRHTRRIEIHASKEETPTHSNPYGNHRFVWGVSKLSDTPASTYPGLLFVLLNDVDKLTSRHLDMVVATNQALIGIYALMQGDGTYIMPVP